MLFEDLGLLFFTSLLLSLLFTPLTISLAKYIGAIDNPVGRSVHTQAMPRMGGLGMASAVILSLPLFVDVDAVLLSFLVGMLVIVVTGLWDDLTQISPAKKMTGQVIASILFVSLSSLSLHSFGNLFALGNIVFPNWLSFVVTIFCMIGIINAFNLSDGLDGLAAGVTLIALLFMTALSLYSHNWLALAIILSLLGALLGFLKFNSYPAKLFMGDTGSLTLGFLISCLMVFLIDFEGAYTIHPMTLAIILAVPISDTLWVMTKRMLNGQSPVSPDKTHLHHRLLALGFSHATVVILIYFLAFIFGFIALLLMNQPEFLQLLVVLLVCSLVYAGVGWYEKRELQPGAYNFIKKEHFSEEYHLAELMGRSLHWFRLLIFTALLIPLLFMTSIPSDLFKLILGTLALSLLAFPWRDHADRTSMVYGLFYILGFVILYIWNVSVYQPYFNLDWYALGFIVVLTVWSGLKIRYKSHQEVFLTSGLEILLIFISWFVPYVLLPALEVSDTVLQAAKSTCLEAIPLLIALKIVARRQAHRNSHIMIAFLFIFVFLLIKV